MKVSYNWLKEFIDLPLSPAETADKLTLIGLEEEETYEHGSNLEGVIVGEVLEVSQHPNADRLKICQVNIGNETVQIVCGANNVAAGQKVPVATVGSTLPIKLDDGSFLILRKAKLRGEISNGMICAEDELGLGTDHEGIMVLDNNLKAGVPINQVFELNTDTIIDIAITPNRPDATCHLGVARDLAAALNLELKKPHLNSPSKLKGWQREGADGVVAQINNLPIYRRSISELPYNPELKERARELRKAGNLPEVIFWNEIKSKKFYGIDFDRQKVIGNYIVDFYVKSLGLVIEIDGSSHDDKQEYDAERDAYLKDLDLVIHRITAYDVKNNLSDSLLWLKTTIVSEFGTPQNPKLNASDSSPLREGNSSKAISINIESPKKCNRYVGKMIKNVEIKDSPSWLKNRLLALGLRPVNNVVDVTNYVMHELGQPLHAFDYDQINGKKIVVKDFDKEVEFETLDHVKRTCAPGTLFICDGNGPVAIAGVMGGLHSEVSDSTTNILLESAYFDPGSIRKTAKAQTLQTDASYRFERGIDPNLQALAAERAAQLVGEVSGGEISEEIIDVHPIKTECIQLTLRKSYLNRLLGTDLTIDEAIEIVEGLELVVISKQEESVTFSIPTFRPDLVREVDLIEEVGRLYDYNKIEAPSHGIFVSTETFSEWEILLSKIKKSAVELGFREIYTNSLISKKEAEQFGSLDVMIGTLNPLTQDMTTLRPSLLHGFLKAGAHNFNRKASSVRFFEIGNVFEQSKNWSYHEGIKEQTHLLFGISGLKQIEHWSSKPISYTLFDLKSILNSFFDKLGLSNGIKSSLANDSLSYSYKNITLGSLTQVSENLNKAYGLDPEAFVAELSINAIQEALQKLPVQSYKPIPKFPVFEFDFAVLVESSVTAGELMESIRSKAGNLLQSIDIFDVYEGESTGNGYKSIAFRLHFLDPNKTLNIKEVEPIINRVVKTLEKKFSAQLRG